MAGDAPSGGVANDAASFVSDISLTGSAISLQGLADGAVGASFDASGKAGTGKRGSRKSVVYTSLTEDAGGAQVGMSFNGMVSARTAIAQTLEPRDGGIGKDQTPIPLIRLLGLVSWNLSYGFICGAFMTLTYPDEAKRLFPGSESSAMGIFLGLTGMTQITCPIAGTLSDQWVSSWGRRRPPFFVSCVLLIFLTWGLYACSLWNMPMGYSFMLFLHMVALNFCYTAQAGLLPDLAPESQTDFGSSLTTISLVLGAIAALGFLMVMGDMDPHIAYKIIMSTLTINLVMVMFAASIEPSSLGRDTSNDKSVVGDFFEVSGLKFLLHERTQYPNFFIVFNERMFYYSSVSCKAFLHYFIRDGLKVYDEAEGHTLLGFTTLSVEIAAVIFALIIGSRVDQKKIKRQTAVFGGCIGMFFGYCFFWIGPLIVGTGSAGKTSILVAGIIYGMGNGAYLAADWALCLATIPDKDRASYFLGCWGLSGIFGGTFGAGMAAGLLGVFGQIGHRECIVPAGHGDPVTVLPLQLDGTCLSGQIITYSYFGYAGTLTLGGVLCFIAGILVRNVVANDDTATGDSEGSARTITADSGFVELQEPTGS